MHCERRSLSAFDPFHAIRRDFERQMGHGSSDPPVRMSISENDGLVSVCLDLPGIREADLSVTVHEGQLVIAGERAKSAEDGVKTVFCNRVFGSFQRTLKLHDSVDPDSVDAVLENGVLTVTFSRRPELKPKTISVRSAG